MIFRRVLQCCLPPPPEKRSNEGEQEGSGGVSRNQLYTGVLYGLINSIMLIPITISFCTIIYRDGVFTQYLPKLIKLVIFSSLVHQFAFSQFSSLPFAIGQVQDAGLIFLSAMSGAIASSTVEPEYSIISTTVIVLPICTFLLGGMLIVVSRLKLASVIQYLPMPVIGGYLAFIGFFCGQAGLAMMANVQVTKLTEWDRFMNSEALLLICPGVLLGLFIYIVMTQLRSPYVLPASMISILGLFYIYMLVTGTSMETAREYGWVAKLSPAEPFYECWTLFNFEKVDWIQLPNQTFRLIGMFLVVAFSSSLDVAAIEMELGLPLDYNKELNVVGRANLMSGLTGGYTGSYIFSQTIFTMRRGVYSRVCGYTVVICELLMVLIPVSIMSYLPKFFFGSLLVLIAVDLMIEWLVLAREKMASIEYVVCVITFFAIQATGIEVGMLIGILMSMMSFVYTYSQLQTISIASLKASTVIRTFEERAALIANRGKVVTISLKGYVFFGSAVRILEDVKARTSITPPDQSNAMSDFGAIVRDRADSVASQSKPSESLLTDVGHQTVSREGIEMIPPKGESKLKYQYHQLSSQSQHMDVSRTSNASSASSAASTSSVSSRLQDGPRLTFSPLHTRSISMRRQASGVSASATTIAALNRKGYVPLPPDMSIGADDMAANSSRISKLGFPGNMMQKAKSLVASKPSRQPFTSSPSTGTSTSHGEVISMPIPIRASNGHRMPDDKPRSNQVRSYDSFEENKEGNFRSRSYSPGSSLLVAGSPNDERKGDGVGTGTSPRYTYANSVYEMSDYALQQHLQHRTKELNTMGSSVAVMGSAGGVYTASGMPQQISEFNQQHQIQQHPPQQPHTHLLQQQLHGDPNTHSKLNVGWPYNRGLSATGYSSSAFNAPHGKGDMKIETLVPLNDGSSAQRVNTSFASQDGINSSNHSVSQESVNSSQLKGEGSSDKFSSSYGRSPGAEDGWVLGGDIGSPTVVQTEEKSATVSTVSADGTAVRCEDRSLSLLPTDKSVSESALAARSENNQENSMLAVVWSSQKERRGSKSSKPGVTPIKQPKSYSDLINTTSPSRVKSHFSASASTPAMDNATLQNTLHNMNVPVNNAFDLKTTAAHASSKVNQPGAMKRELNFSESGFQNNRPIIGGEPALALQPSVPPEYLLPVRKESNRTTSSYHDKSNVTNMTRDIESGTVEDNANDMDVNEGVKTEYLVLDFTAVIGVDATAARSCFLMLVQLMRSAQVVVVFANMKKRIEDLFRAHRVIGPQDIVIPQLDDALEWCEEQVLFSAGISDHVNLEHRMSFAMTAAATDEEKQRDAAASIRKGLARDPSYYSKAWLQRQQLATVKIKHASLIVDTLNSSHDGRVDALSTSTTPRPNGGKYKQTTVLYDNHEHFQKLIYGNENSPADRHNSAVSRADNRGANEVITPMIPGAVPLVSARTLRRILEDYLEIESRGNSRLRQLLSSELLVQYFSRVLYPAEEIVFDIDEPSDKIFFIEKGEVEIVTISPAYLEQLRSDEEPQYTGAATTEEVMVTEEPNVARVNKVSAGGAFGESDFFLGRDHSVRAYSVVETVCWTLDRDSYSLMEVRHPQLCMLIQHSLLKSLAIASTCAMYALYPTTAYTSDI